LNPTGEIYNPNCNRNGMMYLKSLYLTLSDVSKRPNPSEKTSNKQINSGKKTKLPTG
jgi:hypothetical protein